MILIPYFTERGPSNKAVTDHLSQQPPCIQGSRSKGPTEAQVHTATLKKA